MSEQKVDKQKPVILLPINANPPHIGHVATINMLLTVSSRVFVIIYDKMQVCTANQAKAVLESIFMHYVEKDKIEIMTSNINFAKISELPKELTKDEIPLTIATTSKHIYANLKSKGYPYLTLINKPAGWKDEFYTTAYIRSMILGQIEDAKFTKRTKEYINKL